MTQLKGLVMIGPGHSWRICVIAVMISLQQYESVNESGQFTEALLLNCACIFSLVPSRLVSCVVSLGMTSPVSFQIGF